MGHSISKLSLIGAAFALTMGASSTVFAAAAPVTDGEYLHAARCVGLSRGLNISSPELVAAFEKQGDTRLGWVVDQADQQREDGAREARQSSGDQKAKLTAELDGCKAMLH